MKTLFELKNKVEVDLTVFEKMKKTAAELLADAEIGNYTQAIVLCSAMGNQYGAVIKDPLSKEKDDEKNLTEGLRAANDTEISFALCMWQDKGIDIPSYAFRDLLCSLNSKNADSLLFVMTEDGVSGIKLSATMK